MTTFTPPAAGFEYLALRGWTRASVGIDSGNLANNAAGAGSVTLGEAWRLYHVVTDYPARVRLYASTAARTADAARPVGTDPDHTTDHGVLFDFVTTATLLSAVLSPMVDGYCPSGTDAPWAVTNLSGATRHINVTLLSVRTE